VAHADSNDYRQQFLMPLALRMLGDVRGKRILDLGCGEGASSRDLAKRGATVVGVHGSARPIDIARKRARADALDIEFQCERELSWAALRRHRSTTVLAAMSLMDVEDYPSSVHEVNRVLVPGGELLMSITHPCFTAPVRSGSAMKPGCPTQGDFRCVGNRIAVRTKSAGGRQILAAHVSGGCSVVQHTESGFSRTAECRSTLVVHGNGVIGSHLLAANICRKITSLRTIPPC
jgi:2-polyprenyl-3-methyl-5-hydroxy-6-metoxy-1,4-benzoquinol methylase